MAAIDLNADLGETVDGMPTADDDAMFEVISSASIACGGHAGDAASMAASVERAAATGVAIGAHPSYPDRANFGRVPMRVDAVELEEAVSAQLAALHRAGAEIRYVKPHGALYHAAGSDPAHATALVRATAGLAEALGRPIPILAVGSALRAATIDAGLPFVSEAFCDRAYAPDGTLVPRGEAGAVLADPAVVASRAVRLALDGGVVAVDGSVIVTDAASLCIHGDTPGSVALARAVRSALDAEGIEVRAPW